VLTKNDLLWGLLISMHIISSESVTKSFRSENGIEPRTYNSTPPPQVENQQSK
jgi:hypothetical protein